MQITAIRFVLVVEQRVVKNDPWRDKDTELDLHNRFCDSARHHERTEEQ